MCKVIKACFYYVRIFLDNIIDFIFSLYWDCKKVAIPDLEKKHAILTESAVALARKIRQGELKSEDLVRAVIERIQQVNPIINAIAEDRYEAALAEARQVDKLVAAGISEEVTRTKPFLGVPFTTKESQAMKNMRYSHGLWSRRDIRATEDSEAVVRMKAAGAIPVAATNLPEMLIWQETRNPVYGMTMNPHHTGRSPGGSSGAEAALTATYATTISLCSDLGGSTRMPAFYCGMFGHHPTPDTTNVKGVICRKGDEETMLALGFISKHVEDLGPLTNVVTGDKAKLLKLDREVNLKELKYYYLESSDDCHVSAIRPELKVTLQRVISKISQNVTPIPNGPQPYTHEGFSHMYSLWNYWMTKEPDNYASWFNNYGPEANGFIELLKKPKNFHCCTKPKDFHNDRSWATSIQRFPATFTRSSVHRVGGLPTAFKLAFTNVYRMFCMSKHCFFTIMRLLELQVMPKPNAQWAEQLSKEFKDDLFGKLGDNGVLLMPSAPHVAPYHYSCLLRPYNFAYWAVVNMLKCPATQVPLGVNSQGLPLGIQVVAAPYNDALCLAVAKYLDKEFKGSVMACKVKKS